VRHGDSVAPAAQEQQLPIRSRTDQTTQAIRDVYLRVAAEFSGCVSSCALAQRSLPPYCVRTDLVQNQRETGFRECAASQLEVALPQGFPVPASGWNIGCFLGNQAETDEFANG